MNSMIDLAVRHSGTLAQVARPCLFAGSVFFLGHAIGRTFFLFLNAETDASLVSSRLTKLHLASAAGTVGACFLPSAYKKLGVGIGILLFGFSLFEIYQSMGRDDEDSYEVGARSTLPDQIAPNNTTRLAAMLAMSVAGLYFSTRLYQ